MQHPNDIIKYRGTMEQLANEISNLRYDVLAKLFGDIAYYIQQDRKSDFEKGRYKLAHLLFELSTSCDDCRKITEEIWKVCEPYMKEDEKSTSELEKDFVDPRLRRTWIKL